MFILQCLKNTNPNSDEEPEDWMYICEHIADNTYCTKQQVKITYSKPCSGCYREEINRIVITKE